AFRTSIPLLMRFNCPCPDYAPLVELQALAGRPMCMRLTLALWIPFAHVPNACSMPTTCLARTRCLPPMRSKCSLDARSVWALSLLTAHFVRERSLDARCPHLVRAKGTLRKHTVRC